VPHPRDSRGAVPEPGVRSAGPDALAAHSSAQGNAVPGDTSILGDNMDLEGEGAYRDYAGGATSLNDTQERAVASLTAATLSRRLPVLNIQYGGTLGLAFWGVQGTSSLREACRWGEEQTCMSGGSGANGAFGANFW